MKRLNDATPEEWDRASKFSKKPKEVKEPKGDTSEELKAARAELKELTGNITYHGWDLETIKEKIEALTDELIAEIIKQDDEDNCKGALDKVSEIRSLFDINY